VRGKIRRGTWARWSDLGGMSWVVAWVGWLGFRGFGAGRCVEIEPLLIRFQDAMGGCRGGLGSREEYLAFGPPPPLLKQEETPADNQRLLHASCFGKKRELTRMLGWEGARGDESQVPFRV
jgi:hypothetical protein